MGIAAYNRSSEVGRQIIREMYNLDTNQVIDMMNDINDLPKIEGEGGGGKLPFPKARISNSHGVWWIEDNDATHGTQWAPHYPSLRAAVRAWDISLVGVFNGAWIAEAHCD